jgi:hypothetical protein
MADMNEPMPYSGLVARIGKLLQQGRAAAGRAVNTILVQTYWQIGRHIVEFEQGGREKAAYGAELLDRLSQDLTAAYGKGFGRSNLTYIRKLYLAFPKSGTLSHKLSWGHFYEILKADNELERSFYVRQCEKEGWSVRELKRQMKSMLFHRLALSHDKEGMLRIAREAARCKRQKTSSKTLTSSSSWAFRHHSYIRKTSWKKSSSKTSSSSCWSWARALLSSAGNTGFL